MMPCRKGFDEPEARLVWMVIGQSYIRAHTEDASGYGVMRLSSR
jgi:hypothetical protein